MPADRDAGSRQPGHIGRGNGAGTVRTNASAVPHESSWSPGPAACAPTVAAWWSWPAVVSTAPASRARPSAFRTVPRAVPDVTSGGSRLAGAPDQVQVVRAPAPRGQVEPAGAGGQRGRRSRESPPRHATIHSAMFRRVTAVATGRIVVHLPAVLGQRPLPRNGRPAGVAERLVLRQRVSSSATSPTSRLSCQAMTGATGTLA